MILLIDNYDSFAYNLYQLIGEINPDIRVFRNDKITLDEIEALNPEAIVLSPGPGKPENAGICIDVVRRFAGKIPILGVCLGHQSICVAFGGVVSQAERLMHGKSSIIELSDSKACDDNEIMAVKHKEYDVYGLQFHPESILTPDGLKIIKNFCEGI